MFGLSFGTAKWIAIGIAVALVVGYIGFLKLEVGHYQNKAEKYEQAYTAIIHNQAVKLAAVENQVKLQDKQRIEDAAKAKKELVDVKNRNLAEIKKHAQELRSCKLPPVAVELFNSPNGTTGPDKENTTGKADPGDASGTAVMEELTLQELLEANEVNKSNFGLMQENIKAWQKLWNETESNLNGASRLAE